MIPLLTRNANQLVYVRLITDRSKKLRLKGNIYCFYESGGRQPIINMLGCFGSIIGMIRPKMEGKWSIRCIEISMKVLELAL